MESKVEERGLTVPKSVRFQFETRAHEVCELAMFDYGEEPRKFSELVGQMAERWRRHIAGPFMDNDKAMLLALEDFGSTEDVARVYRRGWSGFWHRLLFFRRYSVPRLLCPVILGGLHFWLHSSAAVSARVLKQGELVVGITNFPYEDLIGVGIVLAIVVPRSLSKRAKAPSWTWQSVSSAVVLCAFGYLAVGWSHLLWDAVVSFPVKEIANGISPKILGVLLVFGLLKLLEGVALLLTFGLMLAEIFEFGSPEWKSRRDGFWSGFHSYLKS